LRCEGVDSRLVRRGALDHVDMARAAQMVQEH
jgi:hypothetical protein